VRAIIAGTGPGLTDDVIAALQETDLPIFGCNNTYQVLPLTALLACNPEWWAHYWADDRLRYGDFEKWTWDKPTADRYGIAHIRGEWGDGLSTDPDVIFYGHSSGYQLIGLAYHYGVREFILCGYNLCYPPGYDGQQKITGGDRHFFGEYPPALIHWTRFNTEGGKLHGLLDCYRTIDTKALGIRIINTTPGTALDFFETGALADWL
jgi:hypothetical protein